MKMSTFSVEGTEAILSPPGFHDHPQTRNYQSLGAIYRQRYTRPSADGTLIAQSQGGEVRKDAANRFF